MDRYQANTDVKPIGTLESTATCAGVALAAGVVAFALLLILAGWTWVQSIFGGIVVFFVLLPVLSLTVGRPNAPAAIGGHDATAPVARSTVAGKPGEAARPLAPRDLSAPSPHKDSIEHSTISDARTDGGRKDGGSKEATAKSVSPGPGGTQNAENAPATRVPAPAPINASDPGVARPVGATSDPKPQVNPRPLDGKIVSPEAPDGEDADINRNDAAEGGSPVGGPAGTSSIAAQSYNEVDGVTDAAREAGKGEPMAEVGAGSTGGTGSPVREPDPAGLSAAAAGAANVPEGQERKPGGMDAPRAGVGDDLKKIKGMGPALEKKCNDHGIWHYDQIAAWSAEEVAWADQNLVQFKGRVSRDDWVTQARILAEHEGSGRT